MKWRLDEPFAPRNLYCDFGIIEGIAAAFAVGAAADAAAIALPEIVVGADAAAGAAAAGAAGFAGADAGIAAAGLGALGAGTGIATAADAFGGGAGDLSGGFATGFDAFGNPTGTPGAAGVDQGFGFNAQGQPLDAFGNPVQPNQFTNFQNFITEGAGLPGTPSATVPVTPTTGSLPVADATGNVAGLEATGAVEAGQSSAAFGAGDVGFVGGEPGGALTSATPIAGQAPASLGPSTFTTAEPAVSGTVPGAGVASPSEAISGATGPLQAISDPTASGSIWANTPGEIAAQGPVPDWQLGLSSPPPADDLSSFAPVTSTGNADPFTAINSAAGPAGSVPDSLANVTSSGVLNDTAAALDQPGFAATGADQPMFSFGGQPSTVPTESIAATTPPGQAGFTPATSPLDVAPTTPVDQLPGATAALEQPAASFPSVSPPAAGTTAAGPAAATPGPFDAITGALNSPTMRAVSTVAPLAMLGTTLLRGQPSLPPAANQAIMTSLPAGSLGAADVAQAATGQPTASQLAQIDQWVAQQKNQLYQFYASQGRNPNNDTDYLQGAAAIDNQALGLRQQFVDSLATTGLNAISVANQPLLAAAQIQIQQDQAFQQSIAAALQSFGLVAAINARNTPTQTQPTQA